MAPRETLTNLSSKSGRSGVQKPNGSLGYSDLKTKRFCISFELHYPYRFLSRGIERFRPSARYLYGSLLQPHTYLDHTIVRSLFPHYNIGRVPN